MLACQSFPKFFYVQQRQWIFLNNSYLRKGSISVDRTYIAHLTSKKLIDTLKKSMWEFL